jgi:hypothetical protein
MGKPTFDLPYCVVMRGLGAILSGDVVIQYGWSDEGIKS